MVLFSPVAAAKTVAYRNFANHTISVSVNLNYSPAEDYMFNQLTTIP